MATMNDGVRSKGDEVRAFASRIGATPDSTYGQSCFLWNRRRLFIKISRGKWQFWGVKAASLDGLRQRNQPYVLVLLTTDRHGWFFTDDQFSARVQAGEYKVARDGQYKIAGKLSATEFQTAAEFCEKLGIGEGASRLANPQRVAVTLDLDPESVGWFQQTGGDWQGRMAVAIRLYAEIHKESEGKLVATPVKKRKPRLKELLARVTKDNVHGEVDSGEPVGREVL